MVAFTEDVGLATIASRGREVRRAETLIATPGGVPGCEDQPAPCGAAAALFAINDAYGPAERRLCGSLSEGRGDRNRRC